MSDRLSSDLASLKIDRDAKPESRGIVRAFIYVAIAGGVIAGLLLVAWPKVKAALYKTEVQVTVISMVSPVQESVELTSTGYVVPQVTTKVAAKIPGRIAKLEVKANDLVTAGQVIALLDDADQRSAIASAGSRVAAARARTSTARAQLAETRMQAERERALAAKGVSPKAVVEDLDARARSLAEQVRAAEADVKAAEAEVASLKINLEHTTITAPITGTVIEKFNEVGEMVGPSSGPIVEIADLSTQVVETDVPETRLGLVRVGAPAEIILDAYSSTRMPGRVVEISKRVNRAKATVMVKVKFTGDMSMVIPDMAARVSFLTKEIDAKSMAEPPRLVVPENGVTDRDGAKVVFVIQDGKVKQTPVVIGPKFGAGYVLEKGPIAGTKIVANPSPKLRDGQSVKSKSGE